VVECQDCERSVVGAEERHHAIVSDAPSTWLVGGAWSSGRARDRSCAATPAAVAASAQTDVHRDRRHAGGTTVAAGSRASGSAISGADQGVRETGQLQRSDPGGRMLAPVDLRSAGRHPTMITTLSISGTLSPRVSNLVSRPVRVHYIPGNSRFRLRGAERPFPRLWARIAVVSVRNLYGARVRFSSVAESTRESSEPASSAGCGDLG
jgi:hypothetical protein